MSNDTGKAVLQKPSNGKVMIEFSLPAHHPLSSGSFDGQVYSDYLWVFFKFSTSNGADGTWQHATLAEGGSVKPTEDKLGAFIAAADAGAAGKTFTVVWDYGKDGVKKVDAQTVVKVRGIEMVKIPQGSFFYNAGGIGGSHYNNFGGGREVLVNSTQDIPTGAQAGWPNGYNAFYIGKFETTEGQYCDYLNSLPSAIAPTLISDGTFGWRGYRVAYDAKATYGKRFTTDVPERALSQISWDEAKKYLSWCGLRPMTEMEFEKAARGTDAGGTNKRAYPWGDTTPDEELAQIDGGTHTAHYCNYGITEGGTKPVTVGWYLTNYNDEKNGASPYGVADLAGNLWEQVILCDWLKAPANGNGTIHAPDSWPPHQTGKGWRGGGWGYVATDMRISMRGSVPWAKSRWAENTHRVNVGIRGARSQ